MHSSYLWFSAPSLTSYFLPGCFMKLEHFCQLNHKYLFDTDTILNFNEKNLLGYWLEMEAVGHTQALSPPHICTPKLWTHTMCMGAYCLDTQIPYLVTRLLPIMLFINFGLIIVEFSGYSWVEQRKTWVAWPKCSQRRLDMAIVQFTFVTYLIMYLFIFEADLLCSLRWPWIL